MLTPNATAQPRPEAGARHERTLEGVGSSAKLDGGRPARPGLAPPLPVRPAAPRRPQTPGPSVMPLPPPRSTAACGDNVSPTPRRAGHRTWASAACDAKRSRVGCMPCWAAPRNRLHIAFLGLIYAPLIRMRPARPDLASHIALSDTCQP
jgi:hypothetical protein